MHLLVVRREEAKVFEEDDFYDNPTVDERKTEMLDLRKNVARWVGDGGTNSLESGDVAENEMHADDDHDLNYSLNVLAARLLREEERDHSPAVAKTLMLIKMARLTYFGAKIVSIDSFEDMREYVAKHRGANGGAAVSGKAAKPAACKTSPKVCAALAAIMGFPYTASMIFKCAKKIVSAAGRT